MKKSLFTTSIMAFASIAIAQISISSARALPIGNVVTVKGIVTSGSELGSIRYMEDGTAGIAAYGSVLASVQRGDTLKVTGTLKNFNNLLELDPISSFTIVNSGNSLPVPTLLTPLQLIESNEGKLIQINNAIFANGGANFAASTNYNFTSVGNNGQIRVSPGISLISKTIPLGPVTVMGVLSQFCTSPTSGCTSGYQILVRDTNDIKNNSSISIISPIAQTNIMSTSFNLNWLTDSLGSTFVKYGKTTNLELGFVNGVGNTQSHIVNMTGLTPATIYYAKSYSVKGLDTASSGIKVFATQSLSSGNIKVYFNTAVNNSVSTGTNAMQLLNAIDDTLIAYIDRAKYTLDMTIYDFDCTGISNISAAINNAYARGVRVRFISDAAMGATNLGVNNLNASIQKIVNPTGGAYGIMHNKFVIIDANSSNPNDPLVWTGATNWTDNQINTDPNDVIIIQDQSLAKSYKLEFEEMWGDTGAVANMTNSKFGPYKTDNTPHEFVINGISVQSYFSPSDNVNAKLIQTLNTANTQIDFASMLITRADVANTIVAKVSSGVPAYGIVDDQTSTLQWGVLQAGMIPGHLVQYTPPFIMHHKYMIIDHNNLSSDPILLTGSHNWSSAADQRNDENTLVIHNATIANIYFQDFYELYTTSGGSIITDILNSSDKEASILIYPNPTNSSLCFITKPNTIKKIIVTSISGAIVYEENFINNDEKTEINMNELSSGMYFIQCVGTSSSKTFKIVKK